MAFFRGPHKYNAKRVEKAGLSFDSKAESRLHDELLLREKAGEIKILKLQDRIHLVAGIHMIPDFKILNLATGGEEWVEMKGFRTPEFMLKRRLWSGNCDKCGRAIGPGPISIHYGKKIERIVPKDSTTPKTV